MLNNRVNFTAEASGEITNDMLLPTEIPVDCRVSDGAFADMEKWGAKV
ncbi:MAG: hypothetical protein U5K69_06820 [Balneolaceae bacterium]|nr:hypothetical protein [Balneolaceae bacterium]